MSTLTITEFLEARISEDEAVARRVADGPGEPGGRGMWSVAIGVSGNDAKFAHVASDPARVLAECAAKQAIIKQHEDWPVLVEREPSEIESVAHGLDSITYRMSREIAWLTTKEYVKRFGVEPPTAPMIRALAAVYADHEDYRTEWAL